MTTRRKSRHSSDGRSGTRFVPFLLGFLFAGAVAITGGWVYLRFGHPPAAASDPAFPLEARIVNIPLKARIARGMEKPPFGTSEDVFEAGARIYMADCAYCHGTPSYDSALGKTMSPAAPQLWKRHGDSAAVGVSDDDPGETHWKIANGIRLTGMPAFQHLLPDSAMWDVALLLKNADQPLPDPVANILKR